MLGTGLQAPLLPRRARHRCTSSRVRDAGWVWPYPGGANRWSIVKRAAVETAGARRGPTSARHVTLLIATIKIVPGRLPARIVSDLVCCF